MRRQQLVGDAAQALHFGVDAHEALHQRHVAERVGCAGREIAVVLLHLHLETVGLAHHERRQHREDHAQDEKKNCEPPVDVERQRQQHDQRDDRREMLAEETQPQPPQGIGALQHHLHQAAGMGAGVKGQRQLHDMFEITGENRLTLAMREAVRLQGDERAADDREQSERHPCAEQRPGRCDDAEQRVGTWLAGQHVDDAAEQHRLGELRHGKQQIGDGEKPAEPGFLAEQFKNANIKTDQRDSPASLTSTERAVILAGDRRRIQGGRDRGRPVMHSIDIAGIWRWQTSRAVDGFRTRVSFRAGRSKTSRCRKFPVGSRCLDVTTMARQSERSAATIDGILSAARKLFMSRGFEAVSIDDIAAAAGIAKGGVYHHFSS